MGRLRGYDYTVKGVGITATATLRRILTAFPLGPPLAGAGTGRVRKKHSLRAAACQQLQVFHSWLIFFPAFCSHLYRHIALCLKGLQFKRSSPGWQKIQGRDADKNLEKQGILCFHRRRPASMLLDRLLQKKDNYKNGGDQVNLPPCTATGKRGFPD